MITRVTESRYEAFIALFDTLDLTFRDDKKNYGRRVIKHKPTGHNIASNQYFSNRKPVFHIDTKYVPA